MFTDNKSTGKTRVTIKEIAKVTGYSVSTVSKALNESFEISDETKQKIAQVVKELGYIPNKTALSLRSGKHHVIAVVMPSIENPFYARIFHGIQHLITNTNYSIITCITRESIENEAHVINKIFNQVDAFIVAVSQESLDQKKFDHLQMILDSGKPLVLVDRDIDQLTCDKVISDNEVTVMNITKQVFNSGYKKLALASCLDNDVNNLKVRGFIEASADITSNNIKKYLIQKDKESIDQSLIDLIEKEDIDCILSVDEEASFAAIRVAKKLQKRIPQDLGIVGYMSEKVATNLDVPLTTINQHRKTMGMEAIQLLLNKLESQNRNEQDFKEVKIKSTLVRRTSF